MNDFPGRAGLRRPFRSALPPGREVGVEGGGPGGTEVDELVESAPAERTSSPAAGRLAVEAGYFGGRAMVEAKHRGFYRMEVSPQAADEGRFPSGTAFLPLTDEHGEVLLGPDDRPRLCVELPLPEVVFPEEFLHQRPMSARELAAGARWFVYEMDRTTGEPVLGPDGRPRHNAFFAHLKEMTAESAAPFVRLMRVFFENGLVRGLMERSGVGTALLDEAAREIALLAFGSVIKPEFADPGMQYFYAVIAPVYEFFHQFNTQAMPDLGPKDARPLGPLPLELVRSSRLSPDELLYPNDARGRDGVASDLLGLLAARPPATDGSPRRVLAVGDGPGMTTLKAMLQALEAGQTDIHFTILEYSTGQIENGMATFAELFREHPELKERLAEANLRVEWRQGSAADRNFEEGTFDCAFSTYVVGAMGSRAVVEGYAVETLRALKPGASHVVLDFYDRKDDPAGYRTEGAQEQGQQWLRRCAALLACLTDAPLRQCYEAIWDHQVHLNQALDDASFRAGASFERTHHQTVFAHLPLLRLGGRTLALAVPGYDERKAVYTRPE